MKKILIIGGSHSELPLVRESKKMGLYTITVGNVRGNAHLEADKSYLIDYSNKEAVLELAIKENIDYVCFGAHDLSMITTAYVAEKLNLEIFDDFNTTCNLHHKDKFKKIAMKHNLNITKIFNVDNIDNIEFPVVVKPVDMGGGKGISIVKNKIELQQALKKAKEYSKSGRIIVEEYFKGSLHSISTFIINKKIVFYYVDNEYPCLNNPFGVCLSIYPSYEFDLIKAKLLKEIEKVASIFNLKDGLLHLQFLQNKDEYKLIEFTRRMPGDLYNVPVEYATKTKYSKHIIEFCLGNKPDIEFVKQNTIVGRFCVIDKNIIPNKNIIKVFNCLNANKKQIIIFKFTPQELNKFKKEYL